MVGKHVFGGPDLFGGISLQMQQDRAGAVAGGKKHVIVNDDRRGRADGSVLRGTPDIFEIDFAIGRVENGQPFTREKEGAAFAVNRPDDRRRIARLVFRSLPKDSSGRFIEGNDARGFRYLDISDRGIMRSFWAILWCVPPIGISWIWWLWTAE